MSLRPYQIEAINSIRRQFSEGKKKVLLWMPTGAGKTVCFCHIIKSAGDRNKKTLTIVRGRKLVDQASMRLLREGVEHGVLMAGAWNYRPHLPHQIASIDTLMSRGLKPEADIIIVDEAHMASSKGFKTFLSQYDCHILSVTATPYVEKGLSHIAQSVVHPIKMQELIDQNYLVPFRIFAPSSPDLTQVEVSKSTKDYVNDQLESAMVAGQLTGKIIDHWLQIASDRPTLCFAVNIRHSHFLIERFKEAGIRAEHCDADTSDQERNEIVDRLVQGITQVVCNVGIFCTGVDIPSLAAIIMARPTKSKNLFIQQAGRGTRLSPGKRDCILLDHAGNVLRHGLPTDEGEVNLNGREVTEKAPAEIKICKECFAAYRGIVCTECGAETPQNTVILEESNGKLVEVLQIQPAFGEIEWDFINLKRQCKMLGYKPSWVYFRMHDKWGNKALPFLPEWFVRTCLKTA